MGLNSCAFSGRLVATAKVKRVGESCVATFSLAVEGRRYKGKDEQWTSNVEFLDFELWDTGAKSFERRFIKGDFVTVIASARQQKWEKDGEKRQAIRFRVDNFDGYSKNKPGNHTNDTVDQPEELEAEAVVVGEDGIPF